MNDEEFEKKYLEIISHSLDKLGGILDEVEKLDPIIKENQIRRFKDEWNNIFKNGIEPKDILESNRFKDSCKYLFGRMNKANRIQERILELSAKTKLELQNLKY
jgi:hypothetical protein